MFDTPEKRQKADVNVWISNVLVEICPDVVKNLTLLVPDFKPIFRYKDLKKCSKNNYKRIKLYTCLYLIRQQVIKECNHHIDHLTLDKLMQEKTEAKTLQLSKEEKAH
jgi:hypothetical protein